MLLINHPDGAHVRLGDPLYGARLSLCGGAPAKRRPKGLAALLSFKPRRSWHIAAKQQSDALTAASEMAENASGFLFSSALGRLLTVLLGCIGLAPRF